MRRALAALALGSVLPGCGGGGGTETVTVLAAASLGGALEQIEPAFEEANPDLDVVVQLGGSSALSEQVDAGAPGDVLVTADERTMEATTLVLRPPFPIARNRLTILVEEGNPEGIAGIQDLARPELVVVLCAPEVPCGSLAARALTRAGVALVPASLEENVTGVVSKVTLGEADAGIVYETDAAAVDEGAADRVAVAGAEDPALEAVYVAAALENSEDADRAARFIVFLRGADAQAILADLGFLPG